MTITTERALQPAQTAEELQALAADFEAAFKAQRPFFYGSGTDEEADAMTARVDEIARKIVALPTTDIVTRSTLSDRSLQTKPKKENASTR
jgi:hypothetical protein